MPTLLKLDELALKQHHDLDNDDKCFCWREYTPGTGYNYSETNQLIRNFQISVLETNRKHHKEKATKQIAEEFIQVVRADYVFKEFTFVPIPTSKPYDHSEYDDRLCKSIFEHIWFPQIPHTRMEIIFCIHFEIGFNLKST